MQYGNLSPEQVNKLLAMAGGQLGISAEQLKTQIESGNLEGIKSRLNPSQSNQMSQLLSNPDALRQLLSNPQVANMLKNFTKGK